MSESMYVLAFTPFSRWTQSTPDSSMKETGGIRWGIRPIKQKKVPGFPAWGLIADITTPWSGCTPHFQHLATSQLPLAFVATGPLSDTKYMNPARNEAKNMVHSWMQLLFSFLQHLLSRNLQTTRAWVYRLCRKRTMDSTLGLQLTISLVIQQSIDYTTN